MCLDVKKKCFYWNYFATTFVKGTYRFSNNAEQTNKKISEFEMFIRGRRVGAFRSKSQYQSWRNEGKKKSPEEYDF